MATLIRPIAGGLSGILGLFLAVMLLIPAPTRAQGLIRDAEIERSLRIIAGPLFKAAGVNGNQIDLLVVGDSSLNAFVINGRAIFLHSGLITRLKTIEMLQSVIGHELAHITSGHLVRRTLNLRSANTAVGIGLLLSLAVSATGNTSAASGIAAGTASSAMSRFLTHTRAEETTADQIGTRYMVRAGIDPQAGLEVLELFRGQEALKAGRQDPYARTHPLSQDRIRALKGQIAAYKGKKIATSVTLKYWHARMQAKFKGFLGNPSYILRHVKKSDKSEPAALVRAIAYHRQGNVKKAMVHMNILLEKRPKDAYYHELKGQILLEGRQTAAAVSSYRKAVSLAAKEPLILAGLGRALLATKSPKGDRNALEVLRKAYRMDPRDASMLRDLAVAWAKAGNNGMASLVTAERYALLGRFRDARTNALRAEGMLPRGSAGWLKAQDIIAASKTALKK